MHYCQQGKHFQYTSNQLLETAVYLDSKFKVSQLLTWSFIEIRHFNLDTLQYNYC